MIMGKHMQDSENEKAQVVHSAQDTNAVRDIQVVQAKEEAKNEVARASNAPLKHTGPQEHCV